MDSLQGFMRLLMWPERLSAAIGDEYRRRLEGDNRRRARESLVGVSRRGACGGSPGGVRCSLQPPPPAQGIRSALRPERRERRLLRRSALRVTRRLKAAIVFALIGAAAALFLVPGAAVSSSRSQGTLLVAYNRGTSDPAHLLLLDVATGTKRTIPQSSSGAWSPDGRWIALAGKPGVVLLASNGRGRRQLPGLTAPATDLPAVTGADSFAWAPNSRSLAIAEAGGHRLVIRGIGGGARVITQTGNHAGMDSLSWSPDGRWISYNRIYDGGGDGLCPCSMNLRLIRPDGSADHAVVVMHDTIHGRPSPARWDPSGHRFAFSIPEAFDPRDPALAVVRAGSGKITRLPILKFPELRPYVFVIGWSPDGSELAATQAGAFHQANSVALFDASGHRRALATVLPPSIGGGAWSPDGTKLVISGAQGSYGEGAADLELVDPKGGPPRVLWKLPRGSRATVLAWRPHALAH